jgi:hypothetical protein
MQIEVFRALDKRPMLLKKHIEHSWRLRLIAANTKVFAMAGDSLNVQPEQMLY